MANAAVHAQSVNAATPGADSGVLTYVAESDGRHRYYVELLQSAIDRADLNLSIELLKDIPPIRTKRMLSTDELSVKVMVRNA